MGLIPTVVSTRFKAFEKLEGALERQPGDSGLAYAAACAYALASPGLKTVFSDPDTFMQMVRGQYAPVYRHQSVEFGETAVDGDNVSQVLTIVDDDNQVWKALYKLARQPDGTWLITGCVLIRSTDTST